MPRLSGHRLGLVLTIPVFVVGYTSGLKRAFSRHTGFAENGNECLYPDYERNSIVPYFVRHKLT